LAVVQTHWQLDSAHTAATRARMTEMVNRFAVRLLAVGGTSFDGVTYGEAVSFITGRDPTGHAPDLETQHARRAAVRALYRTLYRLNVKADDPTNDLSLPPLTSLRARPLTDEEVVLCRLSAELGRRGRSVRLPVIWALAEAGASATEIAALRLADVDDLGAPSAIQLAATRRHEARIGHLSEWGQGVIWVHTLVPRLLDHAPETVLIGAGMSPVAVARALRGVLRVAGLADDTDVSAVSARNWGTSRYEEAVGGSASAIQCPAT
jgi:integrase/recombinase XerC